MMRKSKINIKLHLLPMAVVVTFGVMALIAMGASDKVGKIRSLEDKARHFFLRGVVAEASENMSEAYEYYKRAYQTDSNYLPAAYGYGMTRVPLQLDSFGDDSQRRQSLSIARRYVDAWPADFFSATNYAYIAGVADTVSETIRVFERLDSIYPDKTLSLLHLGDAYASIRKYDKAIAALNKYERAEGVSPALTLHKVSYHLADNDTAGAMSEVDNLIESNPGNVTHKLLKGSLYTYLNQLDSAYKYYKEAEHEDSTLGTVKQSLASYYSRVGDSVNYNLKIYEALISEDIDIDEKVDMMATYLQKAVDDKADPERGDRLFAVLSRQYPHDSRILSLSARYNAAKGNFNKALEDISYAIDLDNQNENFWLYSMMYRMNMSDYHQAMKDYNKACGILEGEISPGMKLLYASAAQGANDYDETMRTYDELIKGVRPELSIVDSLIDKSRFNDLNFEQLSLLSNYYEMAGDAAYAITPKNMKDCYRLYENAVFLNPTNAMALNNYAYFLVDEEHPRAGSEMFVKAKDMSRQAVESDSQNPTYLDTFAWILFKEGEYEEALKYQKSAVELAEKNGDVSYDLYSHLGDILFKNGDEESALEYWRKALTLKPDDYVLQVKIREKNYFEPEREP